MSNETEFRVVPHRHRLYRWLVVKGDRLWGVFKEQRDAAWFAGYLAGINAGTQEGSK